MRRRLFFILASMAILFTGCTSGGDSMLPDAFFPDGGAADGARPDGAGPPPVVETCTPESMGSTIGEGCTGDGDCDDGCYCNGDEVCSGGTCAAGADPCPDEVDCTADVCLEELDRCFHDPQHEMCTNGDACDGSELCDVVMGCRAASPLYCNDENSCTVDSCDSESGCAYVVRDLDGDGFVDGRCGGDDCDDDPRFGTNIYPGATENCGNRRDDDCNGLRDYNDPTCVPTNNNCATAQMLPGPGTYSGSTAGLTADYALSCKPTGLDAVFRITLTEMQDVRISVSGGGTGAGVSIRPWGVCATGPDDKCSVSTPPTILRRSLPPGDYAIIVKTNSGAPFDLNVMFEPPTPIPPVDQCNSGTLDVSAGGTFTGFFAEVDDDYALTCHSGSWKDAAYRFTITSPKDVTITGSTSGAAWTPTTYVSLLTDCSTPTSTLQCVASSSAMLRRRGLPAGTYYILLESSATDATMWNLDVSITDPAPRTPGDACSTAIDVTSAPGSTDIAMTELDVGTSCGGSTTGYRDQFWYFDLTATRDVTITSNGLGFHYMSLSTACGVTGSELRCRSGSAPFVQTFRSLPAGRYYVTTSSTIASGTASVSVTTGPPTPVPPNDRCTGAIELGGGYSSTDTLIDFEDDVAGCTGSFLPDAVYRITLTARKVVSIIATRVTGTGALYLTLRNTCGPGSNLACNAANPAVIDTTLDPGTYYLFVESTTTTTGDYTLRAFITDP